MQDLCSRSLGFGVSGGTKASAKPGMGGVGRFGQMSALSNSICDRGDSQIRARTLRPYGRASPRNMGPPKRQSRLSRVH